MIREAFEPTSNSLSLRIRCLGLGILVCAVALVASMPMKTHAATKPQEGVQVSASTPPWTLHELLRRWLEHGKEIEAWRAEIGAAEFDVVTASLLPNPSITVEAMGTFVGRDNPPDGLINFGTRLEVPLEIFGQRRARKTAAERALEVAHSIVATLVWERAAEIRNAAIERAFADAEVVLAERALAELAEIRRVIASRVQAGLTPRYDLMRIDASFARLDADAESARLERDRLEARLLSAVADPSLHVAPVERAGLPRWSDAIEEATLLRQALENRPDIVLERRSEDAKLAEADAHHAQARPTPHVFVGTYIARNDDSVNMLAGLSMPIPAFNRNQGLRGRAHAESRGHAEMARALEVRIRAEVRAAVRAQREALAARERFEQSGVFATTDLLERAWRAYEAGMFSIAELVDAFEAVWDARREHLALDRALVHTESDLIHATGRIIANEASPLGSITD